jgi:hypothetical protein
VAVAVAAVAAVAAVGAVGAVGAVDAVDAVDRGRGSLGLGWGCLAGRSFLDGRRKIRRSQQQRSSNEKEIRTAAQIRKKFASLQMAGLFGTCPEQSYQRAASEYNNSRSQETRDKDGATDLPGGMAVAGCRRSILQAREQEETCQRS